jgi:hypothetical protein
MLDCAHARNPRLACYVYLNGREMTEYSTPISFLFRSQRVVSSYFSVTPNSMFLLEASERGREGGEEY